MRRVESLFADYAAFHQTPGNKWFHRVCIPLIMLSMIGMLTRIELFTVDGRRIDAAMVVIALSTLYYLAVEWRLAIAMLGVSIGFYVLGAALPMWVNVALQVIGWIGQFIGHTVYEHKQPAFFRNLVHLMVGPLWILNDLIPVVRTKRA